jgi:hypothetical protein
MADDRNLSIENELVLEKAKEWFRSRIIDRHLVSTKKLKRAEEFNINPFLTGYLSAFLTGDVSAQGIARALIYSRALATSINTIFGSNLQSFISEVLSGVSGSLIHGIDIQFEDRVDNRPKFAQLKAGPNTINAGDVKSIHDHFRGIRNLARTNQVTVGANDLVLCILYGTESELSSHYKRLRDDYQYPIYVGNDFWHRLTGEKNFYDRLIQSVTETLTDVNASEALEEVIIELSTTKTIQDLVKLSGKK